MIGDLTFDPWSGEWTDGVVTQRDKQLALWSAVDKGDLLSVRAMIDKGMDINSTDMHGNLVLHTVVIWHSSEMVKELIDAGVDVNRTNDNGQTPLHLAADKGKADAVLQLLEGGTQTDIKTKYSEMTALHLAAKGGHPNTVCLLLDHGSNPNTRDCTKDAFSLLSTLQIGKIPEFYAANISTKKEFEFWRQRNREIIRSGNETDSSFVKDHNHCYYKQLKGSTSELNSTLISSPATQTVSTASSYNRGMDTKVHQRSDKTGHQLKTKRDLSGRSAQSSKITKGHSVPSNRDTRGHSVPSNRDTRGHSVHFVKDPHKMDQETTRSKKIVNSGKNPSSSTNINKKLVFSKEHQARMATNVFDRLAGKKQ